MIPDNTEPHSPTENKSTRKAGQETTEPGKDEKAKNLKQRFYVFISYK